MPSGRPARERILQVGPDVPGGMTAVMRSLMQSPLGEDYQLDLVATYKGPSALLRVFVFVGALAEIVVWRLRRRGRVVHIHGTVRGSAYRKAACVLVAKAMRSRVILHLHSGPGDIDTFVTGLRPLAHRFIGRAFEAADVVLAVSSRSSVAWRRAFGERQVTILANPVEPVLNGARPGDEPPLVVFLGGFGNLVKGGRLMLEVLRRPELAGTRAVLAGPGELPADAEVAAGAEWRGWLDPAAKASLLAESGIFVLPSTSEGLPVALLEAMAYGLAIVASDVGGVPDVVENGVEALVVEPGDPAALGDAIGRLRADPRLRTQLGRAARSKAATFSPESIAARLDAIYRGLLRAPRREPTA